MCARFASRRRLRCPAGGRLWGDVAATRDARRRPRRRPRRRRRRRRRVTVRSAAARLPLWGRPGDDDDDDYDEEERRGDADDHDCGCPRWLARRRRRQSWSSPAVVPSPGGRRLGASRSYPGVAGRSTCRYPRRPGVTSEFHRRRWTRKTTLPAATNVADADSELVCAEGRTSWVLSEAKIRQHMCDIRRSDWVSPAQVHAVVIRQTEQSSPDYRLLNLGRPMRRMSGDPWLIIAGEATPSPLAHVSHVNQRADFIWNARDEQSRAMLFFLIIIFSAKT